ncbi:DUF1569 domain-containing protein [Flavobacterium sp. N2270]|uniref:DUF1569 domain-containing protein n=1 Tax=Flavobacterium sp. N2270 TaxID=2986831 RepID=UPI002224CD44|nr:DUF1569 domain-containing protein [Flavobacterium sp. N2270]
MKSIYNSNDNQELVNRINQINSESKPLWGKMSADQMCEHCLLTSNVAFGKQELKINFLMKLVGKMMKNKVFNSEFKKNSPTAPEFIVKNSVDLDKSKTELIKNIQLLQDGQKNITVMNHPFWGKMTYEDWDKLMYNHMDHHLKQFGV